MDELLEEDDHQRNQGGDEADTPYGGDGNGIGGAAGSDTEPALGERATLTSIVGRGRDP